MRKKIKYGSNCIFLKEIRKTSKFFLFLPINDGFLWEIPKIPNNRIKNPYQYLILYVVL